MNHSTESSSKENLPKGLGTFGGVFTPSILTILGIILFLRLGYVVGHGGLAQALIIISIANVISILTSISLAAIATNLKVKGGGDYYLISRTLGLEFGGSIGIVLFLAQSISVGFYCIGFGEAVSSFLPQFNWAKSQIIAAGAVSVLFVVAWMGADIATRFQYIVMVALGTALISFFWGGFFQWDQALLLENWQPPEAGQDFWLVFAVFFPAVTGFTQGVSMSGDLKNPGRSIPLGTFWAVGLSILVYFAGAFVFAGCLPLKVLRSDYSSMQLVASSNILIGAGVVAATLSSAMASFMGAPRILQALSSDRIFPILSPFAQGSGPSHNPRKGVLLTGGIAIGVITLGRLNLIAPLVSMFFLVSYGLLNYATYYEAKMASPSFRPRFRFYDYRLSLIGSLACLVGMLAVNIYAGIAALAVIFGIYQYLLRTAGPASWADSKRSYHMQQIRVHLLAAAKETEHPRHWRPQILAFSDDPDHRDKLLLFSRWIEGKSGLTTMVKIVEGKGAKAFKEREQALEELAQSVKKAESEAFPLVVAAQDLQAGVFSVLQGYGVGPFQANTVLLNWFQADKLPSQRSVDPTRNLLTVFRLGYNILMLDAREHKWTEIIQPPSEGRRIDIWWLEGGATSRFIILIAYLMTRDEHWKDASLRVLAVQKDQDSEKAKEQLMEILESYRIEAQSEIVSQANDAEIVKQSKDANMVFLPFKLRYQEILSPFGGDLEWLLVRLPVVALALASEDIDLDAEPEEGAVAEQAEALQTLKEAQKKYQQAEKEALDDSAKAEVKQKELEAAFSSEESTAEELAGKKNELEKAKQAAEEASKKAAKAKAKLHYAQKEAEHFDPSLSKEDKDQD